MLWSQHQTAAMTLSKNDQSSHRKNPQRHERVTKAAVSKSICYQVTNLFVCIFINICTYHTKNNIFYLYRNYPFYQEFIFKRLSSKLATPRPSKTLEVHKKKNAESPYRNFMTKEPIILGESSAKRMLYSLQFVAVGLFAYSIYALFMFWDINDMLLPGIIFVNIGVVLLVRSIVFAQTSTVTLLPSYRLRFDRFSWFARVNPRNGVEVKSDMQYP